MNEKSYAVRTDDGVELFCRITGEGRPLLLIHGMMVDADFFRECAQALGKGRTVITYDRRGYSRSARGSDYSPQRQARDAARVLRHFAREPADVIGCSAGAVVAFALSAGSPQLIRKTILHEIPLFRLASPTTEENLWLERIQRSVQRGRFERGLREFLGVMEEEPATPLPEETVRRQWKNGLLFLEKEFEEINMFVPQIAELEALSDPGRICTAFGTASGDSYCVRASQTLARMLHTICVPFPGRHNGARDVPGMFAETAEKYLDQD